MMFNHTMIKQFVASCLAVCIMTLSGCGGDSQDSESTAQLDAKVEPALVPTVKQVNKRLAVPENDQLDAGDGVAVQPVALQDADENPFPRRIDVPEDVFFPKDREWLNTKPLSKKDLKGKFVLLDFWTYCCINCIHILPELKKLEKKYEDELVVIGVHSAKFETEKSLKNIREAILRYEIIHPVVNDDDHKIWQAFGVNSWPSIRVVDPEGYLVAGHSGEFRAEDITELFDKVIPYYRKKKLLDETPIRFELEEFNVEETPLKFPGKILSDEPGNRLFITDSNHNRIVITDLDGKLLDIIGSGEIGKADGDFQSASFDHPQGLVLHGSTLYVADTENHMIRKVDLESKTVTTISGDGEQARSAWPGAETGNLRGPWFGKPKTTGLNSPWALWIHEDTMYIAMAGPHQIWSMKLDESRIGPFAGNGREDIIDGALLPTQPFGTDAPGDGSVSSFAQPSGLTSDGEWLYVADTEGSSIRAVPFDTSKQVRTVVGAADLPNARLFTFGDKDGPRDQVLLQHAIGVTYHDGNLYICDTYNNKIKVIDAASGTTATFAGTGKAGLDDELGLFDEPAGLAIAGNTIYVADTNNHQIRTIDLETRKVGTLTIEGLEPPVLQEKAPTFSDAEKVVAKKTLIKPVDGKITVNVNLALPIGWKMNPLADLSYYVGLDGNEGAIDRSAVGRVDLETPVDTFSVQVPVTGTGEDVLRIGLNFYYCQNNDAGLCKVGSVQFVVPVNVSDDAKISEVDVKHAVAP